VDALQARVDALHAEVTQLREQLAAAQKNSSTSSKPPSSDIVKPPAADSSSPRRAGGEPGHPKYERADTGAARTRRWCGAAAIP
jgi:hypothetical protein